MTCIGCELSEKQVEFSKERLKKYRAEHQDSIEIPFDDHED
jgi:DNA modification methylase